MKIGIDLTFLFDQYAFRGIGNLGKEITKELLKDRSNEWVLFGYGSANSNAAELQIKFPSNAKFVNIGRKRKSNFFNLFFFNFNYLPKIRKQKLDLFFSVNFEQGLPIGHTQVAVFIHDVIPLVTNQYSQRNFIYNYLKGVFYRFNLKNAKKANIIFANSDFSKNELITKAHFDETKIRRVYLGIKNNMQSSSIDNDQRDVRRILRTYNITPPYILNYGGIEPNKNVSSIIRAFAEVSPRFPDLKLIIINKDFKLGWDNKVKPLTRNALELIKLCDQLRIRHKISFTGEASENHLPVILANATLMLHLSSYEGFGLTALESLAAGIPLIASNKSCYPEVLGNAALLVDPFNTKLIATKIEEVLANKSLYNDLVKLGKEHGSLFKWENSAKEILGVFEESVLKKLNKKIVFISPYFYPIVRGAENYCLALAKRLVVKGADVTVLTSMPSGMHLKKFEVYNGIKIHRFSRLNNSYYFGLYPGLLFKLIFTKADIIHVQGIGFIEQDFSVFIKKIFSPKTKFINTPHGPFMALNNYSRFAKILNAIYTPTLKALIHMTYNNVIEVNDNQDAWISRYGIKQSKIVFIPNGIDKSIFDESKSKVNTVKEYKLSRKFVISYLGSFNEYKGIQSIISAIESIYPEIKNIKFLAMGNGGEYFDSLSEQINNSKLQNYAELVVNPSDEVKKDILSVSKIFVFPSQWEAFGLAMLEAMALGNAIITTETEGGKFLIKENENGFFVKWNDPADIAEKIRLLANDKDLMEKMSQNNIEKSKLFLWDDIADKYISTLIK